MLTTKNSHSISMSNMFRTKHMSVSMCLEHVVRVFNDLIDVLTKSDFKSFWDNFEIFKIILKYEDLI
jgi:hypothetical protein